jgi:predicted dithiol-disulfide oxidoreductase (DUF899 family)
MQHHKIVSGKEWLAARRKLLAQEKEFTRQRDALSKARRDLPWEQVTKPYFFESTGGRIGFGELFGTRSQLVIYHFMFKPEWEAGCPHCSHWADSFNSVIPHLNQRDVSLAVVSRAPVAKLDAYKKRMGWTFDWVSAANSDFNYDFRVSFRQEEMASGKVTYNYAEMAAGPTDREGVSVFYKDQGGGIFHTYSAYARGIDLLNTDYNYLDLVPKGRDEGDRGPYWVRRHDEYPPR